uniref:NADH-ubiquinone oxidoreductase chain 6 n=1 Tax=Metschnikowia bicuspidata TaxID=27322 RepID=A0A896SV08_9ASCO|nr:NADH dehydrogenase subunit 6 [Metschnikowia bicuspidata]QSD56440.1 NADH dehydrogenase subunit 6 [Metschnikowia bicuspidata]
MNMMSGISSLLAMGILTPVQSMLWLIMLFLSTAMSLYNNDFVLMGMLYIMMYVGAMAMLFLFMLSLLKMEYKNKNESNPLIMTMMGMSFMPLDLCYNTLTTKGCMSHPKGGTLSSNTMNDNMMENMNMTYNELMTVGLQFYTEYAMLLVMTGMMLMLSVVGAMSMVK